MANPLENFSYVFLEALEGLFIDRLEQNEDIATKFMNENEFKGLVADKLMRDVYNEIRAEAAG